ncbi:hypothetical protein [Apibacter sp.]|uniref:hypothetical protein n=1 Tax=Apibacter sp. TaxID=2023709 RepID=UPI0025CC03F4|nr:hypothetical protein [Apibacter sp.]MCT6869606.1 hypothetical protein [Apibacter sp.]
MKEQLIKDIDFIIKSLNSIDKMKLNFIVNKYNKLKELILNDRLHTNVIKGSVRAYLDVFSDYENPILEKMSKLEKKIDSII